MTNRKNATNLEETRPSLTLLLLSDDQTLADLVLGIVKPNWNLFRCDGDPRQTQQMFAQPNVRLIILDDQAVEEGDHGRLLAQFSKHFSGTPLLYIAGIHSDGNEKRARSNGAHYYTSKPLSPERFGGVLHSFLQAQEVNETTRSPAPSRSRR